MLSEPGPLLVWTLLVLVLGTGPLLVLVAAWLARGLECEAQYYPVTFKEPKIWTISGLASAGLDLVWCWWLLSDWLLKKVLLL